MRRIVIATSATLAILALRSFVPNAEAMTFASPASICTHPQMPTWSKTSPAAAYIVAGLMVATGAQFAGPIPIPIRARTTTATTAPSTMATAVSIITTVASRYVGAVPIDPTGDELGET